MGHCSCLQVDLKRAISPLFFVNIDHAHDENHLRSAPPNLCWLLNARSLQTEEKGLTVSQHVEALQGASFLFGMAQQLNNWSIDTVYSYTCHCRYFPRADRESQMGGFGNFARWRFRRCHAKYCALCKLFVANRKRGLESSYTIKIYLNTDNSSDSHRPLQCCPSQG